MTLEELGYNNSFESARQEQGLQSFEIGRVITEHKERYLVKTIDSDYEGEIIGNLRYTATSRADFPAVGDWVAISSYDDDKVLIHAVIPRTNAIERQAVGKQGEKQIIASNIDFAFIVQAIDRDFNINRIERYLTICYDAKVSPIIVLNKIDLIEQTELDNLLEEINIRIKQVPVLPISNANNQGIDKVKERLTEGKTYCLLGSSGVGKSTLLNNLLGDIKMKTDKISESTNRGQHVTTHRELVVLPSGGIIVDNPGMREIGTVDVSAGLEITFDTIIKLAVDCKYKDCTHTTESGCAVIEGLDSGEVDEASYENFLKIEREKQHYESTVAEKKKKDKDLGRMIRNVKKFDKRKR